MCYSVDTEKSVENLRKQNFVAAQLYRMQNLTGFSSLLYLSISVSAFHFAKCFSFFFFAFLEKNFFSFASSCVRRCMTRLSEHQEFSVRLSDARIWQGQSYDEHQLTASGLKFDISFSYVDSFKRWNSM